MVPQPDPGPSPPRETVQPAPRLPGSGLCMRRGEKGQKPPPLLANTGPLFTAGVPMEQPPAGPPGGSRRGLRGAAKGDLALALKNRCPDALMHEGARSPEHHKSQSWQGFSSKVVHCRCSNGTVPSRCTTGRPAVPLAGCFHSLTRASPHPLMLPRAAAHRRWPQAPGLPARLGLALIRPPKP